MGRTLLLFFMMTVLLGVELSPAMGASGLAYLDQSADEDAIQYGVVYLSAHNHYEPQYLSDEILDRDFGLFRRHGLKYVTLVAVWKYLEPQLGEYNEAAIDDLIRVCDFASSHGLKVIVDFHTMMSNNSWTMPVWLSPRKFETVFTDATGTARLAWLNFLGHCASRLNGSESIWSWHMMNEPARKSWACDVSIEDFLELWVDMKAVFRSYSNRPVSIKFTPQVFDDPDHFNRDPRIYDVCDYMALNWYEVYCSRELFSDIVEEVSDNTEVFISEFGTNETDDYDQADLYRQYVDLFHSLSISDCMAWMWRADYNGSDVEAPGVGYNLAKDFDGTPRPAFYFLSEESAAEAYLVVRGASNEIFYRTYDSIVGSWESWRMIPEGATCDSPATATHSGKLYLVVRGMDGQSLWFGSVDLADYSFSGWSMLSGASPSSPTLVRYGSKLVLVVRGFTNIIYYRSYDCVSETWTEWVPVPDGATCDSPCAAMLCSDLHLVVRGLSLADVSGNNTLWHGYVNLEDDGFSGWTALDGWTPSAPRLTASETLNKLFLAVQGGDNRIWINSLNGAAWEGWTAMPNGATCDSPAATVIDGELQIVVRCITGMALWHCYIILSTAEPSSWERISGWTPSGPTLGA